MDLVTTKSELGEYYEICSMKRSEKNAEIAQKIAADLGTVDAKCLVLDDEISFWRREAECLDGKKHQIEQVKEFDAPAVRQKKV
jgi:dTDP-D-glucose 4,6-dehydratase